MSDRKNVGAILQADWNRADQRYARWTETEVSRFQEAWPPMAMTETVPEFTWGELERQLADLAATPETASVISTLISATRKQARFKPPELVLRELLCITAAVMDESFQPCGEAGMS